jgi:hypothetical protein
MLLRGTPDDEDKLGLDFGGSRQTRTNNVVGWYRGW